MGNSINISPEQFSIIPSSSFVEGTTVGEDKTPLPHFVVRIGFFKKFKAIIAKKINFNFPDKYGNTPLHYAAAKTESKFLEVLIHEGLDPCQQNNKGETPLLIAVKHKKYAYIRTLSPAMFIRDNKMRGPLHIAIESNDYGMIGILLNNTPDIPIKWLFTYILMSAKEYHLNCFANGEGFTALGLAVSRMDETMIRTLISYKANVNALYNGKCAKDILTEIASTKKYTDNKILHMWGILNGDNNVYRNVYDTNTVHTCLLTGEYKNY